MTAPLLAAIQAASTRASAAIHDLAELVGTLPPGDAPRAWWISTDPEVTSAFDDYLIDTKVWNDSYADLLRAGGLPAGLGFMSGGARGELLGIIPPRGVSTPPRWWRKTQAGYFVPRKRTRAEKASEVFTLFKRLTAIPRPIDYMPGIPDTLWTSTRAFPVHVRRSTTPIKSAVCAFVGYDPQKASPPFIVGHQWTEMKVSTFHLLKERERAAEGAGIDD